MALKPVVVHSLRRLAAMGVLALVVNGTAIAGEAVSYTYDAQGRLIKVVRVDQATGAVATITYQYDKADNRIRKQVVRAP